MPLERPMLRLIITRRSHRLMTVFNSYAKSRATTEAASNPEPGNEQGADTYDEFGIEVPGKGQSMTETPVIRQRS